MTHHLDALRLEASALPSLPGIYFWRDESGGILYIGKAINLRRRVMSYFPNARRDRRVREMLQTARHITCEVTETELEALFRESAGIKLHKPKYNRALRTPRRVWYIKLDAALEDPVMGATSQKEDDGSLYFGPFPTGALVRETMAFLHDVLPLRKCAAARPRCKPCMYFQMGKCAAPPLGGEYRARHEEAIARLHDMLQGRNDRVAAWLESKRDRMCDSLLFERAREVQERLELLNDYRRQQTILEAAIQCRCVVVRDIPENAEDARVLLVAHGHVVSTRSAAGMTSRDLARWITVHEAVIGSLRYEQNPIDAASVLQRWLRSGRQRLVWAAIPEDAGPEQLEESADYLLGTGVPSALAAV